MLKPIVSRSACKRLGKQSTQLISKRCIQRVRVGFLPVEQSVEFMLNRGVSRQYFVPLIRHRFADGDGGAHIIHEVPGEGHVVGQW